MAWSFQAYQAKGLEKEGAATMKSTGIVRKVDELGRVVIPIELRRTYRLRRKMPLRSMLMVRELFSRSINLLASSVGMLTTSRFQG